MKPKCPAVLKPRSTIVPIKVCSTHLTPTVGCPQNTPKETSTVTPYAPSPPSWLCSFPRKSHLSQGTATQPSDFLSPTPERVRSPYSPLPSFLQKALPTPAAAPVRASQPHLAPPPPSSLAVKPPTVLSASILSPLQFFHKPAPGVTFFKRKLDQVIPWHKNPARASQHASNKIRVELFTAALNDATMNSPNFTHASLPFARRSLTLASFHFLNTPGLIPAQRLCFASASA